MRYLTLGEVLDLHRRLIEQSGGADGVRDLGGLESAVAQPQMSFSGEELYPTIESKATALCFSLVKNHSFVDGNKRIGHAAMETFLVMNGCELAANVDDAERIILALAAGDLSREELLITGVGHIPYPTTADIALPQRPFGHAFVGGANCGGIGRIIGCSTLVCSVWGRRRQCHPLGAPQNSEPP